MIKDTLIREINKLKKQDFSEIDYLSGRKAYLQAISDIFEMLDTLEVKEADFDDKDRWKNTGGFGSTWDPDSPDYFPD